MMLYESIDTAIGHANRNSSDNGFRSQFKDFVSASILVSA